MKPNIQDTEWLWQRCQCLFPSWGLEFFSYISENKSNKKLNYSYPVYKLIKCSVLISIFLVELVYTIFQTFMPADLSEVKIWLGS